MKRLLIILLCLSLLLAGCGKKNPEPTESVNVPETNPVTTQKPTEESTAPTETEPPVPETLSGTALVDYCYVVGEMLDRNDTVEVVGAYDELFYIVRTELGYGLMEKCIVRLEGTAPYEHWTGYAVYNARLFNNYHLLREGVQMLTMNTQIEVLEDMGTWLVVQYEDTVGYMLASELSKYYCQPSTGGDTEGEDGGDIVLGNWCGVTGLSTFIPQEGDVTGTGTVLVNEAEVILGWFDRGDPVAIVNEKGFVDEKEGWYAVYHEGLYGYVRQNLIRMEGEEAYTEWDGFAHYQAPLYGNYYLKGEPLTHLTANASVHVLEDLGNCYLVIVGEVRGYMDKETVSTGFIDYSGGNTDGNTDGDWTPPAL